MIRLLVIPLLLMSAAVLSSPGGAETDTPPVLGPFSVDYTFSNSGIDLVKMKRTLHRNQDGLYVMDSSSKAINFLAWFDDGHIVETSTWQFVDGDPRPLRYEYVRTGRKQRHVELDFDWHHGVVTNTINDDPWQMKIPPGTQDKLLYQLKMMLDLKADRETLAYEVADGGKLKTLLFRRLGEETIKLPIGKLETVKLRHKTSKRTTTVWCAPAYDYLPVRIEHIDKEGRKILMEASGVTGLPFKSEEREKIKE